MNKREKLFLLKFGIILTILILGVILTVVKNEINKKIDYNELTNNTLCNRKEFSKQLEYIANEQAVYYNLDDENMYKDKIDTNQNMFKKYMESKGWKYEVYPESEFAYQRIIFEFTKKEIEIYFTIEKENKDKNYYDSNTFILLGTNELYIEFDLEFFEEVRDLDNIADNIDQFNLKYESAQKEEVDLAEQIFKEFIKDVQSYTQETCSNAVES